MKAAASPLREIAELTGAAGLFLFACLVSLFVGAVFSLFRRRD